MRPQWASAAAAVGMSTSGTLFLVGGSMAGALVALAVAAVFAAEAARGKR
jgi:hypothetical protein